MKMIFLIVLLGVASAAQASTEEDVMVCAGIKDSGERLSCFDAAAKMVLARGTNLPENYILRRFKKSAEK